MAYNCEAALVVCEDFRLHQRANGDNFIAKYIRDLMIDCDLITRAGCIQDLVRPKPGSAETVLRDLSVSVTLHHAKTIYLVGHEDCGAYAHFKFTSREQELAQHAADLFQAKDILEKKFPGVAVEVRFAELTQVGIFRVKEINRP